MRFSALPVLAGHLVLDPAFLGALHFGHGAMGASVNLLFPAQEG